MSAIFLQTGSEQGRFPDSHITSTEFGNEDPKGGVVANRLRQTVASNGPSSKCPFKPRLRHRPAADPSAPSFSFSFPATWVQPCAWVGCNGEGGVGERLVRDTAADEVIVVTDTYADTDRRGSRISGWSALPR